MAKGVGFTIREYAKSDKIVVSRQNSLLYCLHRQYNQKIRHPRIYSVFLVDILEGFYAYPPLKNVVTMGVEDSSYR